MHWACRPLIRQVLYGSVPTISVSILSHNHALKCTTLCSVIVKGRLASHDRLIHPTRGLQQPCHVNPDHTRDHATTPRPHRVYLSPAGETKWHGRSRPRLQSKNARTTTPSIEAPAGITASGLNTAPAQPPRPTSARPGTEAQPRYAAAQHTHGSAHRKNRGGLPRRSKRTVGRDVCRHRSLECEPRTSQRGKTRNDGGAPEARGAILARPSQRCHGAG